MPCSGCPGFGPKVYLAVLLVAICVAVVTVVAVDGGGDVGGLGGDAPGVGTGVGSAAGLLLPSLYPPNFECKHIAGTTVSARFQTWSQISVANILIYLDPNYQTDVCHKLTPDRIFKLMGVGRTIIVYLPSGLPSVYMQKAHHSTSIQPNLAPSPPVKQHSQSQMPSNEFLVVCRTNPAGKTQCDDANS